MFSFSGRDLLPLPWLQSGLDQPSTCPTVNRVYLHRECPGRPCSGRIPASNVDYSCLSALSPQAKPQVRWSHGSSSVFEGFLLPVGFSSWPEGFSLPVGFSSWPSGFLLPVGFSWWPSGFSSSPVGCFWGLEVCSGTLWDSGYLQTQNCHSLTREMTKEK